MVKPIDYEDYLSMNACLLERLQDSTQTLHRRLESRPKIPERLRNLLL